MAYLQYRPTRTLYHYTSPGGFAGIVGSKKLWFSDLSKSNDPREIVLGHAKLADAIRAPTFTRTPFFARLLGNMDRYCKETGCAYCACFTYEGDALPMWREYALNGAGVSIGFRRTALFGISGRIQKVRYLEGDTPEQFQKIALELASKFDHPHGLGEALNDVLASAEAFAVMTALKHASWSYEGEIRIIHAQTRRDSTAHFPWTGELPDGTLVPWEPPQVRQTPFGDVSYLAFSYGRYSKQAFHPQGAIEKVILGPSCSMEESDVEALLRLNGFRDFSIVRSACLVRQPT